ncbi:transposase [Mycolicibacterium chubuense NBB4]|uniref:Transposase n=1 Tax=Mycolicibacterium chubuense (strain NBB4) TaxID=710421 RepID=I4BP20_MYCCN|nr:IS110 family transposase [Mycolicibacterium chubuense]AFM19027.1 transposase [Mycolicibacterium chubuense NBB4]
MTLPVRHEASDRLVRCRATERYPLGRRARLELDEIAVYRNEKVTLSFTCGIDWAESHHDVALIDERGVVLAHRRIDTGTAGFAALLTLIGEHGGGVDDTVIAVETDKNLIVVALVEAGFTVYPINPRAVARYRERFGQAGGKSDPGDAAVLAHILRTDRHLHRRMPANTNQAGAVKVLARQHQEAIWALHQTVSRLRSVLLEFYPQALQAFPNLKHYAATTVLAAAPTPGDAQKLTKTRVTSLLRRSGRGNHPVLAERILTALRTPALRQPTCVEMAYGHVVQGLVGSVVAMRAAVDELEKALMCEFDQHPQSTLLRSVPGLGPVLAARILAEVGDDPARFSNPQSLRAYAGTAPVTIASGRSHYVKARKVRNKRLADACHWWAFTILTKSVGAREHYDRRRAAGDHHNAALRNLANKLLGRLWWCLTNHQPWTEDGAWPNASPPEEATAA